jgi:two-component system sensor histidine kinase QseC
MKSADSLRFRLILAVLGVVTLAWLILAASSYRQTRHEVDEVLDAYLSESVSLLMEFQGAQTDRAVTWPLEPEHPDRALLAFQVLTPDGRLRMRSSNAPEAAFPQDRAGFSTRRMGEIAWRVFSARHPASGEWIQVAERLSSRRHIREEVAESVLFPLILALPVLGGLLVIAVSRALRPMNRIAAAIARRDSRYLEDIEITSVPREIKPIVDQLNGLLARVRKGIHNEQRFTADAAHELRTPLAGIRMQAEVARVAGSDAIRELALEKILLGCDRSARLVDQLLTLARLDATERQLPLERLILSPLAREVLADLEPDARRREIQLEFVSSDESTILGNETWLRILLRNLIDNAIRYSPAGSTVTTRCRQNENGQTILEVEDQGGGLGQEEWRRLTERFYRGEASTMSSGSGLGLSIVKKITELLSAELIFSTGMTGGGLKVQVVFIPQTSG